MTDLAPETHFLVVAGASLLGALFKGRGATALLIVALLSLTVRPEAILGGAPISTAWTLQQSLLCAALIANALHNGIRTWINWPLAALLLVFACNLVLSDLDPGLSLEDMAGALLILALPWLFQQVLLEPRAAGTYLTVIGCLAPLSVVIGLVLHLAGIHPLVEAYHLRLRGALGIAADLALLGFAGLAASLHLFACTGDRRRLGLAFANAAIILFTGTRMALLASLVLVLVYAWRAPGLRAALIRYRALVLALALGGATLLFFYLPFLLGRMVTPDGSGMQLSGRDAFWSFFWSEFLASPVFGRGIGAGLYAGEQVLDVPLPTPHNEYLHLLVTGGIVGFALCAAAIVAWLGRVHRAARTEDRPLLQALIVALALYALTENVLLLPAALPLYVLLTILLSQRRSQRSRRDHPALAPHHLQVSARAGQR